MDIKISVPKAPPPAIAMPPELPAHLSIVWEQFPRIGEKISLMWGYIELQEYLSTIILDQRGGRLGFPKPVLAALLEIHRRHAKVLPEEEI
ncbi:MAG TPA: hypothetical protein VMJ33_06525 [Gallionella sp.]|nr:hypothetical protein [Gallionella sp.]